MNCLCFKLTSVRLWACGCSNLPPSVLGYMWNGACEWIHIRSCIAVIIFGYWCGRWLPFHIPYVNILAYYSFPDIAPAQPFPTSWSSRLTIRLSLMLLMLWWINSDWLIMLLNCTCSGRSTPLPVYYSGVFRCSILKEFFADLSFSFSINIITCYWSWWNS